MSKPLYQTVYETVLEDIKNGKHDHKKKIPSENSLALKFNVSRVTIRQAFKLLEENGYIERKKGSGTYAISHKRFNEKSAYILTFSEEMKSLGLSPKTKINYFEIITPPNNIKKILQLNNHESVYHFQRVRYANDIPFIIETTYMPVKLFPDLSYDILLKSKYHYIENTKKMQIAYSSQTIKAVMATDEMAEILKIERHIPLPIILNTTIVDNGTVIDYTELAINPDYYEIHYIKIRK